jgi:hypothetical protein
MDLSIVSSGTAAHFPLTILIYVLRLWYKYAGHLLAFDMEGSVLVEGRHAGLYPFVPAYRWPNRHREACC